MADFLKDAGGAVKIEDVLPLFPDFARIDAFKGALCDGLADYNAQIQGLRAEMEDATRIADALRCSCPPPPLHTSTPTPSPHATLRLRVTQQTTSSAASLSIALISCTCRLAHLLPGSDSC